MDFEEWSFETNNNNENSRKQLVEKPKKAINLLAINNKPIDSNVLYVKDFSVTQFDSSLVFSNHSEIGSFRIDQNQSYRDTDVVPNLLQWSDSILKKKINLMDGFDDSKIITDYRSYKLLKWTYFLTWIRKSHILVNRSDEVKPHFISFGGLFTSLMMTPFKIESWTIHVTKHNNCIFMNKVRLERECERNQLNSVNNKAFVDRGPYYASKLTSIITKQTDESADSVLNEFEKYFGVYESLFGEHRLLLMTEFDAVDEESNHYEIKCTRNPRYRQKLLNWWSHCVVADIDYILIGMRDSSDILTDIRKLKTEELPDMDEFHWNTNYSYDFVNRLLNYIKRLLENADNEDVYKISYRRGENIIRNTKLMTNTLLPNWFLEANCDENVMNMQIN